MLQSSSASEVDSDVVRSRQTRTQTFDVFLDNSTLLKNEINIELTPRQLDRAPSQPTFSVDNAVILVCDLALFTKNTREHGVLHSTGLVARFRQLVGPALAKRNIRHACARADGLIVQFDDVATAVWFAFDLVDILNRYNQDQPASLQLHLDGIGIAVGTFALSQANIYVGKGFDQAFFLGKALAKNGTVNITKEALDEIKDESIAALSCSVLKPNYLSKYVGVTYIRFDELPKPAHSVPLAPIDDTSFVDSALLPFIERNAADPQEWPRRDKKLRSKYVTTQVVAVASLRVHRITHLHDTETCLSVLDNIAGILRSIFKKHGAAVYAEDPSVALFPNAASASRCVLQLAHTLHRYNSKVAENDSPELKIFPGGYGIHESETVVIPGTDVHWGDAVSTASRFAHHLCEDGEIFISPEAYRTLRDEDRRGLHFESKAIVASHVRFECFSLTDARLQADIQAWFDDVRKKTATPDNHAVDLRILMHNLFWMIPAFVPSVTDARFLPILELFSMAEEAEEFEEQTEKDKFRERMYIKLSKLATDETKLDDVKLSERNAEIERLKDVCYTLEQVTWAISRSFELGLCEHLPSTKPFRVITQRVMEEVKMNLHVQPDYEPGDYIKRDREAIKDFNLFFDDCDSDGSLAISEVEITEQFPKLVGKSSMANSDVLVQVRAILDLWIASGHSQVENTYDVLDPLKKERDGKPKYTRIFRREIFRPELLYMLMLAYRCGMLTLAGYKPGAYISYESNYFAKRQWAMRLQIGFELLKEVLRFIAMPISVFFYNQDELRHWYRHKTRNFVMSTLILTALGVNIYLWVDDYDSVRSSHFITGGEVYTPIIAMVFVSIMINFVRLSELEGTFRSYGSLFPGLASRFRKLRTLSFKNLMVYSEDRYMWVQDTGSNFPNAYEVFTNVWNLVGYRQGVGNSGFYRLIKSQDVRELEKAARRSSKLHLKYPWYVYVRSGLFALAFALVYPLVRYIDTNENGVFLGSREGWAHAFITTTSMTITWLYFFIFLLYVDRTRLFCKSYGLCLDVLHRFTDRASARRIQYEIMRNHHEDTTFTLPNSLMAPWINLGEPKNLYAWDQVRYAIVEEWQERFEMMPKVIQVTQAIVFVYFTVVLLLSLFVVEDFTDGFRWQHLVGGFIMVFQLFRWVLEASAVNELRLAHIREIANARVGLHVLTHKLDQDFDNYGNLKVPPPRRKSSDNATTIEEEQDGTVSRPVLGREATWLDQNMKQFGARQINTYSDVMKPTHVPTTSSNQHSASADLKARKTRKWSILSGIEPNLPSGLSSFQHESQMTSQFFNFLAHDQMIDAFINMIRFSKPYLTFMGVPVDERFQGSFISMTGIWILLVITNFLIRDINV